jgi:hypothetical protein
MAAAAAAFAAAAHAGIQYVHVVDPQNPTFTQVLGINNNHLAVGYGNATTFNGFRTSPPYTSFARENFPGAAGGTQVVGVDNAGNTVGFYVDAAGNTHGFKESGSVFTTTDQPGTVFTQLLGINHGGSEIAGYSSATDAAGATGQKAFSLTGSAFTNVDALLPANFNSQATGVNDAGTVVGFLQYDAAGDFRAFEDVGGTVTTLAPFGSASAQALGINDLGEIVGDWVDSGGAMHGFLDNAGVFTSFDPAGSAGTVINGINDWGQMVGFYTDANGNTVGFITNTPEPASFALLGAGLMFGFGMWRRGRRAAAP